MNTVFALYTGHGLLELLASVFNEELPDTRLVNVVDDSIIADARQAGGINQRIAERVLSYYRIAETMGATLILNTCSSVGEIADRATYFVGIPVVRIDRAMARAAVASAKAIGVVATLPTTLDPTARLVQSEAAAAKKHVSVVPVLAAGAYDALVGGEPETHDRLIIEAALAVKDQLETFVLAQGSMARMEESLHGATGRTVFSSIRLGIREVRSLLDNLP